MMTPPDDRMFGNHFKDESTFVLNSVCTGPEKSSNPMNTNARTYVGTARGSINAQLKNFRPGKSHTAVSHAAPTPRTNVPASTPMQSVKVFFSKSTKRVSTICCQIFGSDCKKDENIKRIGMITPNADTKAIVLKLVTVRIILSDLLRNE